MFTSKQYISNLLFINARLVGAYPIQRLALVIKSQEIGFIAVFIAFHYCNNALCQSVAVHLHEIDIKLSWCKNIFNSILYG